MGPLTLSVPVDVAMPAVIWLAVAVVFHGVCVVVAKLIRCR